LAAAATGGSYERDGSESLSGGGKVSLSEGERDRNSPAFRGHLSRAGTGQEGLWTVVCDLMDTEQTEVNLQVARAFDSLSIPYFLGGSMASSLHGIYRATADADFIAAMRADHAEPLARLLNPGFYADVEVMRNAASSSRSFNLIHLQTMLKVDVFVATNDPFHLVQMRRRILQPISADGRVSMYVASPEDTILAKLKWYKEGGAISDRQWNDVVGVLKVQGAILDQRYLQDWAQRLGLSDLLLRGFDDAGLASGD
jgi:hypothetical protein